MMPEEVYGKLVRDKIPGLINSNGKGEKAITHQAQGHVREHVLLMKLIEEAKEAAKASTRDELIDELADLQQVVMDLMVLNGILAHEVSGRRLEKLQEKGGFTQFIILDAVEKAT